MITGSNLKENYLSNFPVGLHFNNARRFIFDDGAFTVTKCDRCLFQSADDGQSFVFNGDRPWEMIPAFESYACGRENGHAQRIHEQANRRKTMQ